MDNIESFEKEKARYSLELERVRGRSESERLSLQTELDQQAKVLETLTAQYEQVISTAKKVCRLEGGC